MGLRLHYFDFPGRGEAIRLILTVGGVPFEDKRYSFGDPAFAEFKSKTPYGQVPVLELVESGDLLAQSSAIERYCADLAGLLPVGSKLEVAKAESIAACIQDIWDVLGPTFGITDAEARTAARQALLAGRLKDKLTVLGTALEKCENGFVCGGKLSYLDLFIFTHLCLFSCGWLEGLPVNCMDDFPGLQAFRYTVASVPAVKQYYAGVTEGVCLAYKPEAVAKFAPASATA